MAKQQAMRILQQKKQYEAHRQALMQQSFNMEQANFAVDTIKMTKETAQMMQQTAKQMKTAYKGINADSVADLQDDMADLMTEANEMQELFSRSYALPDGADEISDAALAAELDEISMMPAEDLYASIPSPVPSTSAAASEPTKEAHQPMAYPSMPQ